MKIYVLLILTIALVLPALGKSHMPYENGTLVDAGIRHQQVQNYTGTLGHQRANGQSDKPIPVVTVAVDNIQYQGECESFWNRDPFKDMIIGHAVQVKFDSEKRHYFVVKKDDGKDSVQCRVVSRKDVASK